MMMMIYIIDLLCDDDARIVTLHLAADGVC